MNLLATGNADRGRVLEGFLRPVLRRRGGWGRSRFPLQAVDRIIAIGSDSMMDAVAEARRARFKQYFRPDYKAIVSINSSMQCMMKEICAQCLQLQRDPVTGPRRWCSPASTREVRPYPMKVQHPRPRSRGSIRELGQVASIIQFRPL
jgi:hypothetical protein